MNPVAGKQGNSQRGFLLTVVTANKLNLETYKDDTTGTIVESGGTLQQDTWTHVAATYEYVSDGASRVRLYIDGAPDGSSDSAVGPPAVNTTAFEAGRYYWSGGYNPDLQGVLDDLRVYPRALSAHEITNIMHGGSTVDLDEDGLPDAWEIEFLGNTNSAAGDDSDGDGAFNDGEFAGGTDPDDSSSQLQVDIVSSGAAPQLVFDVDPANGVLYEGYSRTYSVEWATDLVSQLTWDTVPGCSNLPASGRVTCPVDHEAPCACYRLKIQLEP
jgi:hypothetical protein